MTDLLFVYGTLLESAAHPLSALLALHGERAGQGTIRARLYIVREIDEEGPNAYPAAVPSAHPEDLVHGEVWRLLRPGAVLPRFDDYEACAPGWQEPYEFLRRPVDVTMQDGAVLRARAYLYTWDVSRAEHVPSGRFAGRAPATR